MLDEMNYVYEVYKEKSFSNAAKNLFISQPALSLAIKKVEKNLGMSIFDRSTNPISLTDAGKIYIEAVEKIRAIVHDMQCYLNDMSQLRTGSLIVSGDNFISSFILPKVIMLFSELYPGINVEIVESNDHDLQRRLFDETIDLLVAHDFESNLYTSYPIMEEKLMLCVPSYLSINEKLTDFQLTRDDVCNRKHLKHSFPAVDLAEFSEEQFLLLKQGNDMNRRSRTLLDEAGLSPKIKIYPDQLLTAFNMAGSGMGCTFVTDQLIIAAADSRNCVFYKLAGPNAHRSLCIGHKRNRYISKAASAFIETAKAVYINDSEDYSFVPLI